MKINRDWSVCYGENSKEIDIQNNRIKREKEVFYSSILEIPPNPKEPWDQEMDYDDSLTPQIPTEQLPDDEDDNVIVAGPTEAINFDSAGTTSNAGTLPETNNRNTPEPDLELLAVLLKNPEIVFALTAGQGGSLTNEQTVKLLDAIKANAARGGSVGSLVDGLLVERKMEEKVEVSLPSPTPSSDPVTRWPESAKSQFSRQSVTVKNDIYALPRVHFQETVLPARATTQEIAPVTHQRFSDFAPDQRNIPDLVPDWRNIPAATHQRFSDFTPDQRNIPVAGRNLPYFPSAQDGPQMPPQQQVTFESRAPPAQSWAGRNSLASSSYSPADHGTNYGAYGTREFVHPGPSWARNGGHRVGPGFEPWGPDDGPVMAREYIEGWDRPEMHGRSNNYRPEMSRMQHDVSRYRDRGGRDGGSRWRERRR